ncbi:hypothetical protein FRB97_008843 [Tulasnella sp. 331]|nr:hypothetical protein FRB97_008843 [Tulasnella sp. 331]
MSINVLALASLDPVLRRPLSASRGSRSPTRSIGFGFQGAHTHDLKQDSANPARSSTSSNPSGSVDYACVSRPISESDRPRHLNPSRHVFSPDASVVWRLLASSYKERSSYSRNPMFLLSEQVSQHRRPAPLPSDLPLPRSDQTTPTSVYYHPPHSLSVGPIPSAADDQTHGLLKDNHRHDIIPRWTSLATTSYTTFPPLEFMEPSGVPTRNQSSTNAIGGSPSTSNHSDPPSTSAAAGTSTSSLSTRKKPGRGPGKKDSKEKATVSVRWDDGDLTERLIVAIEGNDRWAGVFASTGAGEGGPLRPPPQVAKRDLQREIAKYLFASDIRFDLEDKKVLESLAVSVKNKLFKLTTLHTECKQELGPISELKSERDIPHGSDQAVTWARVRGKFPQFFRIRDLMDKIPQSPTGSEEPTIKGSPSRPRTDTDATNSSELSSSGPPPMNPVQVHSQPASSSSALRGAVDLPKGLPPASVAYGESAIGPSTTGPSYMGYSGGATAYPQHSPGFGLTSEGYGYPPAPTHAHRRPPSGHEISPTYASSHPSAGPPSALGHMPSVHGSGYPQPQPQSRQHYGPPASHSSSTSPAIGGGGLYAPQPSHIPHTATTSSSSTSPRVSSRRAHPYRRPSLPSSSFLPGPRVGGSSSSTKGVGREMSTAASDMPISLASPGPPRDVNTPSPPLAQTIQAIVSSLTEKKDKDKAREHELEVMRIQREEAERVRWHQREMLRLRIQLIRAERAAGRATPSGTTAGGTPAVLGGLEDELATSTGLGGGADDGMSMEDEGDGEGELEEDLILEAETSGNHGHVYHHHPQHAPPPQHRNPDGTHSSS